MSLALSPKRTALMPGPWVRNDLWRKARAVPSLDLRFAESKSLADAVTGQSLVTFTRASSGTYVGSDGLIKTAATNEARFDHNPSTGESLGLLVEEARTNLLLYSEQFDNAAWTKSNSTITANSVVAPDGTITADKHQEDNVNNFHYSFQQLTYSAGVYTISAYFKAAERSFAWLYLNTGATATAYFNLATGVVGTVSGTGSPTASITSVANGWYRCTLTATIPATVGGAGYGISLADNTLSYTGTAGSGIYIWGAQLEVGSFPTSYIPTPATFTSRASTATFYDANGVIQTAASDVARSNAFFPDSNGVMRPAGLLLEASGTNLIQQSEAISTSPWSLNNSASVSANSTAAPDGATTADTLGGTTSSSYVEQTIPWSASGNWALSLYMKAGTSSQSKIYVVRSGSQVHGTNINWASGIPSIASAFGCSASVQFISSGWYRVILQLTSVNHTVANSLRITSDNISGAGTVVAWGVQAEQNPYPTSYIPTTTSTVTRAADVSTSSTVTRSADVVSITGANFSGWYRQDEGTLFSDFITTGRGSAAVAYAAVISASGSTSNWMGIAVSGAGASAMNPYAYVSSGGVFWQPIVTPSVANASRLREIVAAKGADMAFVVNGATPLTNNSQNMPISPTELSLSTYAINGTISRLTYWPQRLRTLQAITQ